MDDTTIPTTPVVEEVTETVAPITEATPEEVAPVADATVATEETEEVIPAVVI